MKVNCDGMDMNLGELKLAIKDIKGIKNVTDFDLQVRYIFTGHLDTSTFNTLLTLRWKTVRTRRSSLTRRSLYPGAPRSR